MNAPPRYDPKPLARRFLLDALAERLRQELAMTQNMCSLDTTQTVPSRTTRMRMDLHFAEKKKKKKKK